MNLTRTLKGVAALSLVGLGISLYLTWIYTSGGVPICLGSGGCSEVQASPYAWLLGLPIPAYGTALYVVLIAASLLALRRPALREQLSLALFGLSLTGVLFSAYLTYLEFFVIHAICLWCVTSAVVMLLVFLLTTPLLRAEG